MEIPDRRWMAESFLHLVKNELSGRSRILADAYAVKTTEWDYAELLLMKVFNTRGFLIKSIFNTQQKTYSHDYKSRQNQPPLPAEIDGHSLWPPYSSVFFLSLEAGSPI